VLGTDGLFQGHIRLQDVLDASDEASLGALARTDDLVFDEATTIWEAMERIRDFVGEAVPLVDRHGRLLGVVPEGAVIEGYMEAVHDLRREENAAA